MLESLFFQKEIPHMCFPLNVTKSLKISTFIEHLCWPLQNSLWSEKHQHIYTYEIRKSLTEALVLSELDYCNIVYVQITMYLIRRLQGIRNTTAGYEFDRYYATICDVINFYWVLIKQHIELNTIKLIYQSSLHSELYSQSTC